MLKEIYPDKHRKNLNKTLQNGLKLVTDSFSSILVSTEKRREMEAEEKKEDVLNFIRENKGATVHEISEKFNVSIDTSLLILEKLEKEKKIKLT